MLRGAMDEEYDFVVVGSGFGGSVSALRLTEKGYRVLVLEMGRRFESRDFAKSNWNLRRFLWAPAVGCYGILKLTALRHVFFLHGVGVGGGSLVYANTLLIPPDEAFEDARWGGITKADLLPHYATAKRMLGAIESPFFGPADSMLREIAEERGFGHTFHKVDVGVFAGVPGQTVPDPYFGGEGPPRTGCTGCGACMVGCRVGAKNTLDKNYLYLAEKKGARILPERRVLHIETVEGGYRLHTKRTRPFGAVETFRARGVVLSAGAYGTTELLLRARAAGTLATLSPRVGDFVRTNSEALLAVRSRDREVDHSKGVAITSGVKVSDKTHAELVRYPAGSDVMGLLATVLTWDGPPWPRWLRWVGNVLRRPLSFLRTLWVFGWAKRSVVLLVMQPVQSHLRFRWKKGWIFSGVASEQAQGERVPVYMPEANEVALRLSEKMNGLPQSGLSEVLLGRASTAHLLGGCAIGRTPEDGVVDAGCRVFGFDNLYVIDGSVVPANLGVNPSLTITALAEHAMSKVPARADTVPHPLR